MNVARPRTYAGLAAAIVPGAMIVHLIAEAAAVGDDGLRLSFVMRHAYFALLFAASLVWFGVTAGVGCSLRERRRRCALLRAGLRGADGRLGIATIVGANFAFFALTQALEGNPIAVGSMAASLSIALAGSVSAALLIVFFGRALANATIDLAIGSTLLPNARRVFALRAVTVATPRHATIAYSLLRPNRPPPGSIHF